MYPQHLVYSRAISVATAALAFHRKWLSAREKIIEKDIAPVPAGQMVANPPFGLQTSIAQTHLRGLNSARVAPNEPKRNSIILLIV